MHVPSQGFANEVSHASSNRMGVLCYGDLHQKPSRTRNSRWRFLDVVSSTVLNALAARLGTGEVIVSSTVSYYTRYTCRRRSSHRRHGECFDGSLREHTPVLLRLRRPCLRLGSARSIHARRRRRLRQHRRCRRHVVRAQATRAGFRE